MQSPWKVTAGAVMALALAGPASADQQAAWPPVLELDHVLVQTSLYTRHHSPDPEHTNQQKLASVELHNQQRWLAGAAWFKNSFDQPTWYWYVGREFPFWQPAADVTFRAKLTAGALRGYRGEYRDKIPFNRHEIAPAALPSIGVQWGRFESDLILFGTAGLMVTAGIRF
ncbi:hypothetical protein [Halomonas sp. C05BenzN]|uniref:hypothetical protein n=1 Tax=Halomonas sp. C05BenzN TaxID=3411041 RepID=UPI003B928EB8